MLVQDKVIEFDPRPTPVLTMRLFCSLLVVQILFSLSSFGADVPESTPKKMKRVSFKSAEDENSGWDARFEAISNCQDKKTPVSAKQYFPCSSEIAIPTVLDESNSPIFALNDSIKLDFSLNWKNMTPSSFTMDKDEILLYKRFFAAILGPGNFSDFVNQCLRSNSIDFSRPIVLITNTLPPVYMTIPELYVSNHHHNPNSLDMFKTLMTCLPFGLVNKDYGKGMTFLYRSILSCGPKVISTLLDFGADTNLFSLGDSTQPENAGMLAIRLNKPEIVKLLAETGRCDPKQKYDMMLSDITGYFMRYRVPEGVLFLAHWPHTTPECIANLLLVLESRSPKFAHKVLLQLLPFERFAKVFTGRLMPYTMSGNLDSFEATVQHGYLPTDIYMVGGIRTTLFHRAVHHHSEHMIPAFIKAGLNPELAADEDVIPLIYAVRKNNTHAVSALINFSSQEAKTDALRAAVFMGRHDCAYIISKHFENFEEIKIGSMGLVAYAAWAHYPNTLWALLADSKVDPFKPDSNGFTLANGKALPCNQHIIRHYIQKWQEKHTYSMNEN